MALETRNRELEPSPLKLRILYRSLGKQLSMTPLFSLCEAIWALNRMQSDPEKGVCFFRFLPREVLTRDLRSPYFVHQWRLETLFGLFFIFPGRPLGKLRSRTLDLSHWGGFAKLLNLVHNIEDEEAKLYLRNGNPWMEFHRMAQRQFPWQRGYANRSELYRHLRCYRNDSTRQAFEQRYGLAFDRFTLLSFIFWAQCRLHSWVKTDIDLGSLGIGDRECNTFLKIVSMRPSGYEHYYRSHSLRNRPVAYFPSGLRDRPIMQASDAATFISPLPDLVFQRGTSGLYYDFVGNYRLKESIADGFVDFSSEVANRGRHGGFTGGEFKYERAGRTINSPDLFLLANSSVKIAIECKSRRMSIAARFGGDPVKEAEDAFAEIAKGVVQLWRYVRDGEAQIIPPNRSPSPDTRLLVLTLDHWTDGGVSRPEILKLANARADAEGLSAECRKPVAFANITEFEYVMDRGSMDQILRVIAATTDEPKYNGWGIETTFDDLFGQTEPVKFDIDAKIETVAPWWKFFSSRQRLNGFSAKS